MLIFRFMQVSDQRPSWQSPQGCLLLVFQSVLYIYLCSLRATATITRLAPFVLKMFSNSAFLTRKEPWERGKTRRVSHGEQLQRGAGGKGEHHCSPNVFHTSRALCSPSPAPHPLSAPGIASSSLVPRAVDLLSHSLFTVFYYSLSLLHFWVLQSSPIMRFIFFPLLLLKTRSRGSLYQQLLLSNPQITGKEKKEKLEFKEKNRIFCKFFNGAIVV